MTVPVSSPSHPGVWRPPWIMTATNTAIPAIAEPIKMNNVVHEGFFATASIVSLPDALRRRRARAPTLRP